MFSGVDLEVVSFKPSEEKHLKTDNDNSFKSVSDISCQTEKEVKELGCQAKTSKTLEIQTDGVVQNLNSDYNVNNLASFLNRVYPSLMEELDKVEKSKAFTLYQYADEGKFENTVNVIHTIQSETLPELPKLRVSCIDWSCTDNVVILGYESTEHADWCTHSSCVDFYNIKTSDFNGKTPTYSIPTTSCVTALAAHPYEPAIVAVGTAGGEVHIWNLQRGQFDADIGNAIFHEDRVTKLSWENINSQLYLVSTSVDSYMFFYKISTAISSVQLYERYIMTTDTSRLRAGILNFSFSIQPGVFAVALENGEVIHCSTFGAPSIPNSAAKNPVLRVMCQKKAMVLDIKFSPFSENIFVAVFSNNRLVCFSLKETAPLYQIFLEIDMFGLSWSTTQKDIVYLWGKCPKLHVYKAGTGTLLLELEPDNLSLPIIKSISFCSKSPRLAASGIEGKAVIWDVPPYFKI